MTNAQLQMILPNSSTKVRVSVPINVPIYRIEGSLLRAFGLSPVNSAGKLIAYRYFRLTAVGVEEEIDKSRTVEEIDLGSDDMIRLYAEVHENDDETEVPPYLHQFAEMVVASIEARLKPDLVKLLDFQESANTSPQVPNHILAKPIFGIPSHLSTFHCDIFVIMPFAEEFFVIYSDIIKPVAEELDLVVKRGDDFFSNHTIVEEIWAAIARCRVVIADCTGRNANVFYELGIAHTLGKPTVLITQNIDDVPFDIQGRRFIEYQDKLASMNRLRTMLKDNIRQILST